MKKRRRGRRGGEEERRGKKIAGGSESRGWRKEPKGLKEGSRRPQVVKGGWAARPIRKGAAGRRYYNNTKRRSFSG
jgi:hypothetical protein